MRIVAISPGLVIFNETIIIQPEFQAPHSKLGAHFQTVLMFRCMKSFSHISIICLHNEGVDGPVQVAEHLRQDGEDEDEERRQHALKLLHDQPAVHGGEESIEDIGEVTDKDCDDAEPLQVDLELVVEAEEAQVDDHVSECHMKSCKMSNYWRCWSNRRSMFFNFLSSVLVF